MLRRFWPAANTRGVKASSRPQRASARAIGKLQVVTGSVTIKRADIVAKASAGDSVYQDDAIETGADGSVTIVFVGGTAFSLRSGTVMVL